MGSGSESESHLAVSNSLGSHGPYSPWNSPGQNIGVGSLSLCQPFPSSQPRDQTQDPTLQAILYQLSHQGSPRILEWVAYPFSRGSSRPRNWTGVSCIKGGWGSYEGSPSKTQHKQDLSQNWTSLVPQMVKNLPAMLGDLGLIPGLGRSPGEGNGNPLQYSCLENPHGQRSLAGYSPWGCKELDTAVTKHSTPRIPWVRVAPRTVSLVPRWPRSGAGSLHLPTFLGTSPGCTGTSSGWD